MPADLTRALALVDAIIAENKAFAESPEGRAEAGDDDDDARDRAALVAGYTAKFGSELEAVGVAQYLAAAFVRLDMTKLADPNIVDFFWRPRLGWADVLEIARGLAEERWAVYFFGWFAWQELGLDVRTLAEHPELPSLVRDELRNWRGSAYLVLEDRWIKSDEPYELRAAELEARLRAQGAPMLRK